MSFTGIFGPREGHQPLFNDLCRLHELDKKTKLLLLSVMQKFQPNRPTLIFVDSAWLRKALEHSDFADSAEQLQELYDSWFGNS